MSSADWIWSEPHKDYYTIRCNELGQPAYFWAKDQAQTETQASSSGTGRAPSRHDRYDSAVPSNAPETSNQAVMPAPVDWQTRQSLPNFIEGTPHEGWYNRLDSSYRMRTGAEAYEFFKKGRVFAMLYSEAASETSFHAADDDSFTVIKYGEHVFSQIRRFVIISVRNNFVLACAIFTYGDRGTLKPGCFPTEHAVAYNSGVNPWTCYLPGEREAGLKDPIEIAPSSESNVRLRSGSRIRFGKLFCIEWNVKVKDIGRVVPNHRSLLSAHYAEEESKWDTAE